MQENRKNNRDRFIFSSTVIMVIFLLSSLFIPVIRSFAATDFVTVDRETYRLYNEQKWDSVIILGKIAFKEKIDYFYLRLRVGISYYWLKKYILAIEHLNKAREFNSIDPTAAEYLYLSYIFSGKNQEAHALSKDLPWMIKEKLQIKNKLLDQVHFEGGYTFSSDNKQQKNLDLMKNDSIYGEQDLYGNHSYYHLDLLLNLPHGFNLTIAYNYLRFSNLKYFQYGYTNDHFNARINFPWGYRNRYSWNKYSDSYCVKYTVNQHELFLSSTLKLPKRFKLSPAFHFIYFTYPETSSVYNPVTITDTLMLDTIRSHLKDTTFVKNSYSFLVRNKTTVNYILSLTLTKDFSIFTTSLSGSYSNLNDLHQTQLDWSLAWYPLGNPSLYGVTEIMEFFQEKESRLIFQQHLGGKVLSHLWLEGSVLIGDLTNANLSNGFIVYNNTDKINYRLGANLLWTITKNIDLSIFIPGHKTKTYTSSQSKTGGC